MLSAEQVTAWIRDQSDDRDELEGFAQATTEEVAKGLKVSNSAAYKALAAAARKGLLEKSGRVHPGKSGWKGNLKGFGFQRWCVNFDVSSEK
jgi:transposase